MYIDQFHYLSIDHYHEMILKLLILHVVSSINCPIHWLAVSVPAKWIFLYGFLKPSTKYFINPVITLWHGHPPEYGSKFQSFSAYSIKWVENLWPPKYLERYSSKPLLRSSRVTFVHTDAHRPPIKPNKAGVLFELVPSITSI